VFFYIKFWCKKIVENSEKFDVKKVEFCVNHFVFTKKSLHQRILTIMERLFRPKFAFYFFVGWKDYYSKAYSEKGKWPKSLGRSSRWQCHRKLFWRKKIFWTCDHIWTSNGHYWKIKEINKLRKLCVIGP